MSKHRQLAEWEKIFLNRVSAKGLMSKLYKELYLNNSKKPNSEMSKGHEHICLQRKYTNDQ